MRPHGARTGGLQVRRVAPPEGPGLAGRRAPRNDPARASARRDGSAVPGEGERRAVASRRPAVL